MWDMRTKMIPFITEALRTITKGLDQNLQLLPGHLSAIQLQKVTLKSTAQCVHKVLG
jgi:hypothetical protein